MLVQLRPRLLRKSGLFFRQGADRVSAPTRPVVNVSACPPLQILLAQLEHERRIMDAKLAVAQAHFDAEVAEVAVLRAELAAARHELEVLHAIDEFSRDERPCGAMLH